MGGHGARRLGVFTALHFLVDFCCIFLLCGPVRQALGTRTDWALAVLVYNGCAFALQMPLGVLADALGRDAALSACGCALVALAFLLPSVPLAACVTAGVGNALFHLGGGRDALAQDAGRAGRAGVFVSSGAVGVWLGVWCARRGGLPSFCLMAALLTGAMLPLLLCRKPAEPAAAQRPLPDGTLPCALCLFLTVLLRSYLGGLFGFPWKAGALSLVCVLCVAFGKAAGGLVGDRLGFARAAWLTLGAAAALFLFSFSSPPAGLAAVLLFNTTMPLTLAALTGLLSLPRRGFAFGLTTFALFLGTLPDLLGAPRTLSSPLGLALGAAASLALLLPGLRRRGDA